MARRGRPKGPQGNQRLDHFVRGARRTFASTFEVDLKVMAFKSEAFMRSRDFSKNESFETLHELQSARLEAESNAISHKIERGLGVVASAIGHDKGRRAVSEMHPVIIQHLSKALAKSTSALEKRLEQIELTLETVRSTQVKSDLANRVQYIETVLAADPECKALLRVCGAGPWERLTSLETLSRDLQTRLAAQSAAQTRIYSLEAALARSEAASKTQNDQDQRLKNEQSELDTRRKDLDTKQQELKEIQRAFQKAKQKLGEKASAVGARESELQDKVIAVETRESELAQRANALETKESELKERASALEETKDSELEDSLNELTTERDDAFQRISELEAEIGLRDSRIKALADLNTAHERAVATHKPSATSIDEEEITAKFRVVQVEKFRSEWEKRHKRTSRRVKKEKQGLEREIVELKSELGSKDLDITNLLAKLMVANRRSTELEDTERCVQKTKNDLTEVLRATGSDAQGQIAEKNPELTSTSANAAQLRQQVEELTRERDHYISENQEMDEAITQAHEVVLAGTKRFKEDIDRVSRERDLYAEENKEMKEAISEMSRITVALAERKDATIERLQQELNRHASRATQAAPRVAVQGAVQTRAASGRFAKRKAASSVAD